MPDPKAYERRLAALTRKSFDSIRQIYESVVLELALKVGFITLKGQVFKIADYPILASTITAQLQRMHASIFSVVVNSMQAGWNLSNEKNNVLVDKRLAGKTPSAKGAQILYDPNRDAMIAHINRKEKGLNLSDRVWNSLDGYRTEMEAALGVGISEGKSAAEMARDMKRFLNEPDKLFRRVRDVKGNLKLSKAAREYHPGQGVYRSSYKNALRLTSTETNIAYCKADSERWKHLPFVTGIEVHLSKNHPEYDICDELAGKYPKDFVFTRWHPNCRCFQTAVQISDAEYDKMEDAILEGKAPEPAKQITELPAQFTAYLEKNAERIAGWKNEPLFLRYNKKYTAELMK